MRRGDANVRAIFNAAQRSLILLVDYVAWDGHEPDDRVDATYRFYDVDRRLAARRRAGKGARSSRTTR